MDRIKATFVGIIVAFEVFIVVLGAWMAVCGEVGVGVGLIVCSVAVIYSMLFMD